VSRIRSHGIQAAYYRKTPKGVTRSRNLGVAKACGEILLFLDDDVTLDSKYILGILSVYEGDPGQRVGGVSGVVANGKIPGFKKTFLRLFCLDSNHQGRILPSGGASLVTEIQEPIQVDWLSGCGMSYRKKVFQEFSFDEKFVGNGWGDDRDFSYRVGKRYCLMTTPHAILDHHEDPKGRASPLEFGRMETHHFRRFFQKNMTKTPTARLTHIWALCGVLLKNLTTGRWACLSGNLKGLRK